MRICKSICFFLVLLLLPTLSASADDVAVTLDASSGFVVEDNTSTVERLRIDEATGNIWRNGELFVHTTGDSNSSNTFVGKDAGNPALVSFSFNSAFGGEALSSVTSFAGWSTAIGHAALRDNTSGSANTAVGASALISNIDGDYNSAVGLSSLLGNTTGNYNVAVGYASLGSNQVGDGNIAIGSSAGYDSTGSDNIYIGNRGSAGESGKIKIGTDGTHAETFIAGVFTSAVAGAIMIANPSGKIGTQVSSARFKQDIRDMGAASNSLLELRPVTYQYRQEVAGSSDRRAYGLIAEEVAAVAPNLVIRDDQGLPYSVRYAELPAMLINEFKKQQRRIEQLESDVAALRERLGE